MVRSVRFCGVLTGLAAASLHGARAQETLFGWSGNGTQAIGGTIGALGDVDGDGTDDVAFYVPLSQTTGEVDIESRATGALIRAIPIASPPTNGGMAAVGDTDGDGVRDFLIVDSSVAASLYSSATGAHRYDLPISSRGRNTAATPIRARGSIRAPPARFSTDSTRSPVRPSSSASRRSATSTTTDSTIS
jgi:hypothetical protein